MTSNIKSKRSRKKSGEHTDAALTEILPSPDAIPVDAIVTYKGFNQDMICRDFKFEIGGTYHHDGGVKVCGAGFHACEHPLNVFRYYAPSSSRFAITKQWGKLSRDNDDTKVASASIHIEAEIKLPELIHAAVRWVFDRAKWVDGPIATESNEAATASGNQGAATASGYQGAVRGKTGCALFSVYREPISGKILHAWAGIVGQHGINPDTWYQIDENGSPFEVTL